MRGKTQAERLTKMVKNYQLYDHYKLALPLIEVKSSTLESLKEGDIFLLGSEYLSLVLLEGQKVYADLLPVGTQGYCFEVTAAEDENVTKSPKCQILILALDKILRKRFEIGDIVKIRDILFDKINIWTNDTKIAEGSLINVDGKIALQIDKVEENR